MRYWCLLNWQPFLLLSESSSRHNLSFIACFPVPTLLPPTALAAQDPSPLCRQPVNAHPQPQTPSSFASRLRWPQP
jgi:hypothetical protein